MEECGAILLVDLMGIIEESLLLFLTLLLLEKNDQVYFLLRCY